MSFWSTCVYAPALWPTFSFHGSSRTCGRVGRVDDGRRGVGGRVDLQYFPYRHRDDRTDRCHGARWAFWAFWASRINRACWAVWAVRAVWQRWGQRSKG